MKCQNPSCKKPLTNKKANAKFCSDSCRFAVYAKQNRMSVEEIKKLKSDYDFALKQNQAYAEEIERLKKEVEKLNAKA